MVVTPPCLEAGVINKNPTILYLKKCDVRQPVTKDDRLKGGNTCRKRQLQRLGFN